MNAVDIAPLLAHVQPGQRILEPLRPKSSSWKRYPLPIAPGHPLLRAYAVEYWYNRAHEVQVISSIESVSGEGPESRHEYHVSISRLPWMGKPSRCPNHLARWVLKEFDFVDCSEDNHVPHGIARNYWRPVAENQSPVCHCVETEPKIVEDKGDYVWRPT